MKADWKMIKIKIANEEKVGEIQRKVMEIR